MDLTLQIVKTASGDDFFDMLAINLPIEFVMSGGTSGQGTAPSFNHIQGGSDVYERTTPVSSIDLSLVSAPTAVSEATSLAVFGLGLLGLFGATRRRKA